MASSNSKTDPLRVFFLPYLMAGHMIPMVDIARLFATHGGGVHVTIVTTPANALVFRDAVARDDCRRSGGRIRIHTLSLPPGSDVENLSAASTEESFAALAQAIVGLREPAERLLREELPDCVVSDMFYPWTADVAAELGIPRLLFNGSGYFHLCASRSEVIVESGAGSVLLSGLPDRVTMLRSQIPDWTPMRSELRDALKEAEEKSYGAVMNSFEDKNLSTYLGNLPTYFSFVVRHRHQPFPRLGPILPIIVALTSIIVAFLCFVWLSRSAPQQLGSSNYRDEGSKNQSVPC